MSKHPLPISLAVLLIVASASCVHHKAAPSAAVPPDGCVTGISGPTINAGDAVRNAQLEAREALASRMLSARVKSTIKDDGREANVTTSQDIRGLLNDTVIVEMWTRWSGLSRGSVDREVHAIACPRGNSHKGSGNTNVPGWILDVPRPSGELCALGLAGPVMRGTDHEAAAAEDGFSALAAAMQLEVNLHLEDNGTGLSDVTSRSSTTEELVALCRGMASVRERWLDKNGKGPLCLDDTMYVLVCMPRS